MFVFKVKVVTKNFLFDIWAVIKNITGGKVTPYSELIEKAIQEAYSELHETHPTVKNIKLMTCELMKGAAEIIVYGETEDDK